MVTVMKMERLRTGLSLKEFAHRHCFPETTLCQVERGRTVVPLVRRHRLAGALNLPVERLCDERGWLRWEQAQQLKASA